MADDEKKGHTPNCRDGDTIVLGQNIGGVYPFVRHHANHHVAQGFAQIRPIDGVPAPGSTLLKHREGNTFDAYQVQKGGSDGASLKGPPAVTTNAYRNGWDNLFGKKSPVGQA
jgi:hypothetical protein